LGREKFGPTRVHPMSRKSIVRSKRQILRE
jgi:hypothetical protein